MLFSHKQKANSLECFYLVLTADERFLRKWFSWTLHMSFLWSRWQTAFFTLLSPVRLSPLTTNDTEKESFEMQVWITSVKHEDNTSFYFLWLLLLSVWFVMKQWCLRAQVNIITNRRLLKCTLLILLFVPILWKFPLLIESHDWKKQGMAKDVWKRLNLFCMTLLNSHRKLCLWSVHCVLQIFTNVNAPLIVNNNISLYRTEWNKQDVNLLLCLPSLFHVWIC